MEQEKKQRGKPIAVIAGVCLVVLICIAVVLLMQKPADLDEIIIKTPYCDLYYPGTWGKELKTQIREEDPYTVSFSVKVEKEQQPLFEIVFDGTSDLEIGSITDKDGQPVSVGVILHDVSTVENGTAMQEALGYLIERLPLTQTSESDVQSDVVVETPYGDIVYPGKWKEYVQTAAAEADGYVIAFTACFAADRQLPLFDIVFGGTAGSSVGYLETEDGESVRVAVQAYELGADAVSDPEEEWRYYEMREDVNYILQNLSLVDGPQEQTTQAVREAISVETPYITLSYTSAWGEDLYTETVEGENCTVTFYGKVSEQEPQPLFAVVFGDGEGRLLGEIKDSKLPVYLQYYTLSADGSWSQEDRNTLYAMQEEVNSVIQNLKQDSNFLPVS